MSHGSRKNTEKDWVKVTGTKRAQKHAQDKFQGRETKSRYSTISIASTEEEGKSDDVFENDPAVLPTVEDEDGNLPQKNLGSLHIFLPPKTQEKQTQPILWFV